MFFKEKFNRFFKNKKSIEEFKKEIEETPLEKNDAMAMIIAALVTFTPALLIIIGIFLLVFKIFF